MSMPADAINAILTGTPAPLHLWVMNETSGTTFVDQVVSGNKPLTKNAGCTVNGWGNVGGKRGYGGPQTPAPLIGGATGGASASGATLGGLARGWSIIAFMDSSTTSLASKTLYCERGTSGNDQITWSIGSGSGFSLAVCDDTVGNLVTATSPTSNTAVRGGEGQFHAGGQLLGCSVDPTTGKVDFYCNGHFGIGTSSQAISANHTWTNAGATTNIGVDPLNTANAFPDALCWVAVFPAAFTRDQFEAWYEALTPVPAHGSTWKVANSGLVYPKSAFWNTRLPASPAVDPNSAAIISQWTAYLTAHTVAPAFTPYVPMQDLQTTGRGVAGIRTGFIPTGQQHLSLSAVPTPDTLISGDPYPSNISSDAISWVVDSKLGQQYDAFTLVTANGAAGASLPSSLYPPYTNSVTPSTASGSLAAGTYFYAISAVNSNGESFSLGGYQQGLSAVLSATGKITLSIQVETAGTPPPTSWKIYRSVTNNTSYQLLTTVTGWTSGTMTFVDDGSFTPTAGTPITLTTGSAGQPWGFSGAALTQDYASKGGGMSWDYLKNAAFNPCFKDGTTNNGESASSCPAGAGVVTVEEALNGVIPHPIAVAMPSANNWQAIQGHRWPAPRHDGVYSGAGFPTMEGMILQLDPTLDPNSLTYSATPVTATFQKAFVVAAQTYGLVIRDSTPGGMFIYAEETGQSGRDHWTRIFDGLFNSSTNTANAVLGMVPWGSLRVLSAFRYPSKTDAKGRRTSRLEAAGFPTPVPY